MATKIDVLRDSRLNLDDQPILDFIGQVDRAREDHLAQGLGHGLLLEHAANLKVIQNTTHSRHVAEKTVNMESGRYWSNMTRLAFEDDDCDIPLLPALVYTRLNIILGAEFKPDETPTTQLIRNLGARAIVRSLGDPKATTEDRVKILSSRFYRTIDLMLFGDAPGDLHPEMRGHIENCLNSEDTYDDFALARVMAIAKYKEDPFIYSLPDGILANFVARHPEMFGITEDKRADKGKGGKLGWRLVDVGSEAVPIIRPGTKDNERTSETKPAFKVEIDPELQVDLGAIERAIEKRIFTVRLAACRDHDKIRQAIKKVRLSGVSQKAAEAIELEIDTTPVDPLTIMFVRRGKSPDIPMEICNGCAVRTQCLAHAISENLEKGIRGGVNEKDRLKIKKAIKRRSLARAETIATQVEPA